MFKTYDNKYNISIADYELITNTFFTLLGRTIVDTGNVYRLPYRMGTLSMRKRPIFGRGTFDYQLYKETGIKRYRQNNHSSNYVGTFYWDTHYGRFDTKLPDSVMLFKPARDLARYSATKIRDANTINKYYDY